MAKVTPGDGRVNLTLNMVAPRINAPFGNLPFHETIQEDLSGKTVLDVSPSSWPTELRGRFPPWFEVTSSDHIIFGDSNPKIVERGFIGFHGNTVAANTKGRIAAPYPPLSNVSYKDTNMVKTCEDERPCIKRPQTFDGAALVVNSIAQRRSKDQQARLQPPLQTIGQLIAKSMNFHRPLFDEANRIFDYDLPTDREQRVAVAAIIDDALRNDKDPFDLCKVCLERHIAPGPPNTLQDRDFCGSLLPDWFPIEHHEHPWTTIRNMVNDYVRIEEIEKGFRGEPEPPRTWTSYLDRSQKWKTNPGASFQGSCRKCLPDNDAMREERVCTVCHCDPAEAAAKPKVAVVQLASPTCLSTRTPAFRNDEIIASSKSDDDDNIQPRKSVDTVSDDHQWGCHTRYADTSDHVASLKMKMDAWTSARMKMIAEADIQIVLSRLEEAVKQHSRGESSDTAWMDCKRQGLSTFQM